MSEKLLHMSTEMLDKCLKIKNGIVWGYLCAKSVPLTVSEISAHFKIPIKKLLITLQKLVEIRAIFPQIAEEKLYYIANPETYFHTVQN